MFPTDPTNQVHLLDKPKRGGPSFHKPGCVCNACKSRRRKEEAELDGNGETSSLNKGEVLHADIEAGALVAQDRSGRGRIAEWIALRSVDPTLTNVDIAEKLGIQPRTLNSLIARATREGWLKFDNPFDRLEHEIVPLAVTNFKNLLKDEDKNATLEAMKGIVFPLYKESKGINENQQSVLAIKIEYPKQDGEVIDAKLIGRGSIVGKPNVFDN